MYVSGQFKCALCILMLYVRVPTLVSSGCVLFV